VVLDSKKFGRHFIHIPMPEAKPAKCYKKNVPAGSDGSVCHPGGYRLHSLCSPYSYRCAGEMQLESGLDSRIFMGNGEFSRDAPELQHTTIAEGQIRDPNGCAPA
jgi:hypothetical protein